MAAPVLVPNPKIKLKQIYDLYRTALLNKLYYADRLASIQRHNLWFEITQAIGTSATLGTWGFFKNGPGNYVWLTIAGTATIISIIKPILQWSKQIEKYGRLYTGHSNLYLDLKIVVDEIAAQQALQQPILDRYGNALNRYKELSVDDDPKPSRRKIQEFEDQVNVQIPAASLWYPPKGEHL